LLTPLNIHCIRDAPIEHLSAKYIYYGDHVHKPTFLWIKQLFLIFAINIDIKGLR
jgi:hypothetical protein